jgi:integrase
VQALAEVWFSEIAIAVELGELSPGTGRLYRDRLDNQVLPAMGGLRLREVSVSRVDRMIKKVREVRGVAIAKATRSVLSGMFGLAARHHALPANPVRDIASLPTLTASKRTLDVEEVWDLRAKLRADQKAVDWDLVDFADAMLATGLRIGETSAITWSALDLDAGTVEVRGTVIRIKGRGPGAQAQAQVEGGLAGDRTAPLGGGDAQASPGGTSGERVGGGVHLAVRSSAGPK